MGNLYIFLEHPSLSHSHYPGPDSIAFLYTADRLIFPKTSENQAHEISSLVPTTYNLNLTAYLSKMIFHCPYYEYPPLVRLVFSLDFPHTILYSYVYAFALILFLFRMSSSLRISKFHLSFRAWTKSHIFQEVFSDCS